MRSWLRRTGKILKWAVAALVVVALAAVVDGWTAFGKRAPLATMQRSPEFAGGKFHNPQPLDNPAKEMLRGMFHTSDDVSPRSPVPVVKTDPALLRTPTELRVTWLGHSTSLVEIEGTRVLFDPVWSDRVGPVHLVGPRPWYPPPIALADLPPVDVVVISHDHYDHLDMKTIQAMREWKTRFVVPTAVGANLRYWGIPADRIEERDWWESTRVGEIEIVCLPARHAAGREVVDDDGKLWAGWALLGHGHRVYYSGDTGLFPAMHDIGAKYGPFDLTMIEVGQYGAGWPDWHIGPEQAVKAHAWVRGRLMLPVHWAKLALAYHGWTEPIERVLAAAGDTKLVIPRPGQTFEPANPPPVARWWPSLPWHTAARDPIVSTLVE